MAKKVIIDTNVILVAAEASGFENRKHYQACFDACCTFLEDVTHDVSPYIVVLDAEDRIFDEYCNKIDAHTPNSVGERFMKWLFTMRWHFQEDRISLTPRGDSFVEFPVLPPSIRVGKDNKFLALANAHPDKPPIYEATDSKWLDWQKDLKKVGIHIEFLCLDLIHELHA